MTTICNFVSFTWNSLLLRDMHAFLSIFCVFLPMFPQNLWSFLFFQIFNYFSWIICECVRLYNTIRHKTISKSSGHAWDWVEIPCGLGWVGFLGISGGLDWVGYFAISLWVLWGFGLGFILLAGLVVVDTMVSVRAGILLDFFMYVGVGWSSHCAG